MNNDFLRRIKNMQKELETKQKELDEKTFTVSKQGIEVVLKGDMSIVSIEIDELLIDPEDKDILQDLITIAINEGIDLIKEEQDKLAPSMPGMPF
ncbi:YbaB/EbfC family nucleoid-associated protein [Mycoplasma sp. 2045]|uniref:YbaB/EbfC family nucleoid-associated protein n=1 Tax=unclassified Mycoplasma TaxID=2683645 RepID=UPI00211CFD3D|nr:MULTISPECIES: YbaB/EbfC family nucleoid-associated protein [unclassified Mycoplasma]MEA4134606.1 YbaB/EbfC family nucleoid-associated protein [Mycoplasma sp. 2704]MEA4162872.1 YbaB/EbfC family nucleoid-associated protein [Mycoplasma sp. 4404]MEA4191347.1 YbaB/EbfC family nucleoid-associated protein [Mycoplasma sp. 2248]MEA4205907.1 YbaB/EbfC family nucleoid-associated protein [Mycoplasma sp. 1199]MEA4276545.1 YbaB/EbfC family nucleoid-associated protein [Mycoplasma sp. 21DD0573]